MSDTDDKQCLFFDARGCGPSAVRLIEREIREHTENGKVIVPRAFGLCWEVAGGDLRFVEDGGFFLESTNVDWLIAKLTAWRDAPRLEARKTPTVVADRDGFRLLTTTSGEWGIADDECIGWLSSEDEARHQFRDATGTVSCEACARFIDHEDAAVDSEGIYTCDDEAACGAAYDAKEQSK